MQKVLITGATGFIGLNLMYLFKHEGYEVLGWDKNGIQKCDLEIKRVDLLDKKAIKYGLMEYSPSIIVHCAGSADVAMSIKNSDIDFKGNVTLTHNILFSLYELNLTDVRFVFLSSAAVYGNPKQLPITEETLTNPLSPYALHKVMCEDICRYFINNYGLNIKIARIFSAYGKGLKKQIFWDMYNKVISTGKLEMFGTGNESRDYIHIKDVIYSLFLIALTNSDDLIFNVANGEEISIKEVCLLFAKVAGISQNNIFFTGNIREGDPINWKADISKIKSLGYKKSVLMYEGVLDYYEWAKER